MTSKFKRYLLELIHLKNTNMTIKKSMIITVLALGTLGACTEKKEKKEETTDPAKVEATQESTPEVKKTEEVDEAEKTRLDSIKQVKEHGHAH
jgi:uncharacterized lipoprotein